MDRLRQYYPWLSSGLDYFTPPDASSRGRRLRPRVGSQARPHARAAGPTHAALRANATLLWAQLDALYFAYVKSRLAPTRRLRPQ